MIKKHINLKINKLEGASQKRKVRRNNPAIIPKRSRGVLALRNSFSPALTSFDQDTVPPYVVSRVLYFINQAQDTTAITSYELLNNPLSSGAGYSIGEKVAQRIIDKRNGMEFRQFITLSQLDDVQGLGEDKILDLLYTFSKPASQVFRQNMYANLLGENWEFNYDTITFEEETQFLEVANDSTLLLELLSEKLKMISLSVFDDPLNAARAGSAIKNTYMEVLDYDYAAIALALWLYRVDADNWFNFERALAQTRAYLAYGNSSGYSFELRLFKGYPNKNFITSPVTNVDLPVILDYAEQNITIWRIQLND